MVSSVDASRNMICETQAVERHQWKFRNCKTVLVNSIYKMFRFLEVKRSKCVKFTCTCFFVKAFSKMQLINNILLKLQRIGVWEPRCTYNCLVVNCLKYFNRQCVKSFHDVELIYYSHVTQLPRIIWDWLFVHCALSFCQTYPPPLLLKFTVHLLFFGQNL